MTTHLNINACNVPTDNTYSRSGYKIYKPSPPMVQWLTPWSQPPSNRWLGACVSPQAYSAACPWKDTCLRHALVGVVESESSDARRHIHTSTQIVVVVTPPRLRQGLPRLYNNCVEIVCPNAPHIMEQDGWFWQSLFQLLICN